MTGDASNADDRSRQIDAAIAEYLEALDLGAPLDGDVFLARNTDLATELREFLADYNVFKRDAPRPNSEIENTTNLSSDPDQRPTATNGASLDVLRYFGDYELVEEIARGGMGVVYKARQTTLNRTVAVKMILAGQLASPAEVERFYAEAQAAATLDHPNIVPVFEVGQHQEQHYFSMGYVEGGSLSARIAAGPLPACDAAELVQVVCRAVQYAHEQGVVHRDLKPGNILLDRQGRPRVTDFGLAKRTGADRSLTATGQVLGTPSYMPPEQAAGRVDAIGPTADVYSLGAILYSLLTGRPPFQAASSIDTLRQVMQSEPLALRQLIPDIPRDLETIALKCLEKSIPRRYASAQALAEELDRFLAGRPIVARPVSRIERAWRWCKRNPVVSSLAAAVAVSLISGALVSTYFAVQAIRETEDKLALAEQEKVARADAQAQKKQAEELGLKSSRMEKDNLALTQKGQHDLAIAQNAIAQQRNMMSTVNRTERELSSARADAQKQKKQTEDNAAMARWRLYHDKMNQAQIAWEDNHISVLRNLLDRTIPKTGEEDLRGFEWYYLHRQCHRELMTLNGHSWEVTSAAFNPDGKLLASAGNYDLSIKLWDVALGQEKMTLKGHTSSVISVAFSPDGKHLASASADQTIKLWDVATGRETMTLKGHASTVESVAFSPDGKQLASASWDQTIKLWDLATGQETMTLKGHAHYVKCVAFSPDGRRLASASSDTTIKIWNVGTGQETMTLKGHSEAVRCVAFSPDGKLLASASSDYTIKLWDIATGQETKTLKGHGDVVRSVAFSPDGKCLASASHDSTIKLWDLATGQETTTLKGHGDRVTSVAFSLDGKLLASASKDETIKLWDVGIGPVKRTLKGDTSLAKCVTFSPDSNQLIYVSKDGKFKSWDIATEKEADILNGHDSGVTCFAVSPNGKQLAAAGSDQMIRLWDLGTEKELMAVKGHGARITTITFSPDGQQLASASDDKTIKLWDLATGTEKWTLKGHNGPVVSVVFRSDGKQLASSSSDNTIKLWNVTIGNEGMTLTGYGGQVAYSPDRQRLASSAADEIRLKNATGSETMALKGHRDLVTSIAFSPDGKRLASASVDKTIKVWDVATGQETMTLDGNGETISSIAFSPDGRLLASVSQQGTIKLWDARRLTGKDICDTTPPIDDSEPAGASKQPR